MTQFQSPAWSGIILQAATSILVPRPTQPPILGTTVVSQGVKQSYNKDKYPTVYLVLKLGIHAAVALLQYTS
jgi:hypothetical protein